MELDRRVCDRARQSRDTRFDGRFFIAVTTTGIYCRPTCPARAPKDEHVLYFRTAAAAAAAGFRPCLRCRPDASPGTPAWLGTAGLVPRALRLIGEGALDMAGVERLADRLGVTARHLRRLFLQHVGATPLDVAMTRRVQTAKKLLDETTLPIHQVASASGFGSVRRFNGEMLRAYHRAPAELRRDSASGAIADRPCYRLRLGYRVPYDWDGVLAFLRTRAIPGVEAVDRGRYRRTIAVEGRHGVIDVWRSRAADELLVDVHVGDPECLLLVADRVRRVFDLGADSAVIGRHLRADPLLRPRLAARPGVRVPGAWSGFEIAVRAILGQQISVRAATTIAGRIAAAFGAPVRVGGGLDRLFPTPSQLATAAIEEAGVIAVRAEAIRMLARRVLEGAISLESAGDLSSTLASLRSLPGIGAWTAEYIAMRAFGEPDALPAGDRVIGRMAGNGDSFARRSEAWRPWRAYAVVLLWQGAAEEDAAGRKRNAQAHDRSKLHDRIGRAPRRPMAHRAG